MWTEAANEEETALVEILTAARTPLEIATALVRLNRSNQPAPEELFDDARMRDSQDRERESRPVRGEAWSPERARPERSDRLAPEDVTWFRLSVGRDKNADPKWLIPLICRRGHVTKPEIGQIRIFDRDTKFEIAKHAEARFLAAIEAAGDADGKIEPTMAPSERSAAPRGKPAGGGYKGDRPKPDFKPRPDFTPRTEFKPREPAGEAGEAPPRKAGGYKGTNFKADYDPRADRPAYKAKSEPRAEIKPRGEFKPRAEGGAKPPFKAKGDFKGKPDFKAKGDFKGAPFKGKPKPKSKSNAGPKPRYEH
jgi:ATP-dependent RNA helicase DeaD